jgi:Ankyrin repeats (many copies)
MPLRIASSHSDSFTYPADPQEGSHTQDAHGEEEEEFVYPGIGDVDAASGVLPVPSSETITSTPSPSESTVPLDSSDLTEYPSSNEALHETSPSRPDPNPNPSLPAQPHASPAQLEALYAAASSGDLPLLQRTINNALHTGNVESFSLVNGASSRTGLTAMHAAASRGYIDIVKWCKASFTPRLRAF